MAARQEEEGRYETQLFVYFLACKGLSHDDVGVARGTVFQETRLGAGFENVDFVEEKLGELPQNDSNKKQVRGSKRATFYSRGRRHTRS